MNILLRWTLDGARGEQAVNVEARTPSLQGDWVAACEQHDKRFLLFGSGDEIDFGKTMRIGMTTPVICVCMAYDYLIVLSAKQINVHRRVNDTYSLYGFGENPGFVGVELLEPKNDKPVFAAMRNGGERIVFTIGEAKRLPYSGPVYALERVAD